MAVTSGQSPGPYLIGPLLGAGGMGAVYRAMDSRLKRNVALKVLKIDSPDARSRFEREARPWRRSTIRTSSPSTRSKRPTACPS